LKCSSLLCALAAVGIFGAPKVLVAQETSAQWFEMVRSCEQVVIDQSFRTLEDYEAAPFSVGKPGIKELAVYSETKDLVAIARAEKGVWVSCSVREIEETDKSRWRQLEKVWHEGFEAQFPKSKYRWVQTKYNPNQPFIGAMLCQDERSVLLVMPVLIGYFHFRVDVRSETSDESAKVCANTGN
jgi:hypothetical protein